MSAATQLDTIELPQRFTLKLFVKDASEIDPKAFIAVFHRWIQNEALEGLPIDLHDYSHVNNGPGVILVAHEAHYRMDATSGGLGLLYVRKRDLEGDLAARLRQVFQATLAAAKLLESDDEVSIAFDTARAELRVEDRLLTPNTPETFAALQPMVADVCASLWGQPVALIYVDDEPRGPLTIRLEAESAPGVDALERALR